MPDIELNGYRHHYEEVGSGTPLIFLASTRFDSAKSWVAHMQANAAGFRVIMPDVRGMADSEHTFDVEPDTWVEDLAAFLDRLGLDVVHLAAETLGSRIITRFAHDHPERVKSLSLNAVIAYSEPSGDEHRRKQADPANITPEARERLRSYHGEDALDVNRFYVELHGRADYHAFYDLRPLAPKVAAPVLLLRGDVDEPQHPVSHSVDLHGLFPNSRLQIFAGTEFSAMKRRPAESWALIRALAEGKL
ncbi:MAG: alpha/beta hydrolase [Chloroflexota bacterium]